MTWRRGSLVSIAEFAVCVSLLTGAAAPASALLVRRSAVQVARATPSSPAPVYPLPPLVAWSEPAAPGHDAPVRRLGLAPGPRGRRPVHLRGRSAALEGRAHAARRGPPGRGVPGERPLRPRRPARRVLGRSQLGRRRGSALWGHEGARPGRRRRALGFPRLRRRLRAEERGAPRRVRRQHGRGHPGVLGPRDDPGPRARYSRAGTTRDAAGVFDWVRLAARPGTNQIAFVGIANESVSASPGSFAVQGGIWDGDTNTWGRGRC